MKDMRIYVAGHTGMVGSAIVRCLRASGYSNIVVRSRRELDLLDGAAVRTSLNDERPDFIFLAAAKVGGIQANSSYPASFLFENLAIETNVIHAAARAGVSRLLFLGSSCIYPRDCPQPIREDYLLTSPLEPTNEPYAIAKIAGVKLCDAYNREHGTKYFSVMPTNLYGPCDNYDLNGGHVLPALLRKAHEAKVRGHGELMVWGSGEPRREFLHVDDAAEACVFMMERGIEAGLFNVGTGAEVSIRQLAELVMEVVGLRADLVFDRSKPDGTPRKLLDVSRLAALGWQAKRPLREGIAATYEDFLAHSVAA